MLAGHGKVECTDGAVHYRYSRNENCLDLSDFPGAPFPGSVVYFLSGVMASDDSDAGDLFLFRAKAGTEGIMDRADKVVKVTGIRA